MAVIRNGVGQRLMRNLFRTISLARFVDKLIRQIMEIKTMYANGLLQKFNR